MLIHKEVTQTFDFRKKEKCDANQTKHFTCTVVHHIKAGRAKLVLPNVNNITETCFSVSRVTHIVNGVKTKIFSQFRRRYFYVNCCSYCCRRRRCGHTSFVTVFKLFHVIRSMVDICTNSVFRTSLQLAHWHRLRLGHLWKYRKKGLQANHTVCEASLSIIYCLSKSSSCGSRGVRIISKTRIRP